MKRNFKILTISRFSGHCTLMLMFAQNPPHPGDPTTTGGTTVGGTPAGAPIGDGIFILITLAVAYGSRKIYVMRSAAEAEKA